MPVTEENLKERIGKVEAGKLLPQLYVTFAGRIVITLLEKSLHIIEGYFDT